MEGVEKEERVEGLEGRMEGRKKNRVEGVEEGRATETGGRNKKGGAEEHLEGVWKKGR